MNSRQGAYFGNFIIIMGIAAIFSIDPNYHMLKDIIFSYEKFLLGAFQFKYEDFS